MTFSTAAATGICVTGLQLAQNTCTNVFLAERDYYDWAGQSVFLRRSVALGSGPFHLLVAAHECAHHEQNLRWPWVRRILWLTPVLIALEVHAWLKAITQLSE